MKKFIFLSILALTTTACSRIITEPGTETVLVDKPYLIGHGGVRDESQKPGAAWYFPSTYAINVPVVPIKLDEKFDDLITAGDNIPVDFNSFLQLQISDPVSVIKKYGERWYDNNLKEQYRTIVRNAAKKYTMNQLLSDNESVKQLENSILSETKKLVADNGLPVRVLDVNLGKVLPDGKILEEINETGRQKQRSKTMEASKAAEDQRKMAESARAAADNAYRNEMGMSPEQFLRLEDIKNKRILYETCKGNCSIVLTDGSHPVLLNTK